MNVDDTGSNGPEAGTLTSTTLSGLGMGGSGGITYSGLVALNIALGSGPNTFNILSTKSGTSTTLNAGAGVINIGSLAPSNRREYQWPLGRVAGHWRRHGHHECGRPGQHSDEHWHTDQHCIDWTWDGWNHIQRSGGFEHIPGQWGQHIYGYVRQCRNHYQHQCSAHHGPPPALQPYQVSMSSTSGHWQPATGGNLNGIQGALTVIGDGSDILNVDDTGSSATNVGTLTGAALSGLGNRQHYCPELGCIKYLARQRPQYLYSPTTNPGTTTSINVQARQGLAQQSRLSRALISSTSGLWLRCLRGASIISGAPSRLSATAATY